MSQVKCPKCGSHNVRSIDNESLYHPTKQEVVDGLLNYDSDAYLKFVCDTCDNGETFTKVFKLLAQTEFEEGEINNDEESGINSTIMEQAGEIADKLTELECKILGVECYIVELDEQSKTEIYSFTEEAQKIFDVYYDEQMSQLYTLFNRQLKIIQ